MNKIPTYREIAEAAIHWIELDLAADAALVRDPEGPCDHQWEVLWEAEWKDLSTQASMVYFRLRQLAKRRLDSRRSK